MMPTTILPMDSSAFGRRRPHHHRLFGLLNDDSDSDEYGSAGEDLTLSPSDYASICEHLGGSHTHDDQVDTTAPLPSPTSTCFGSPRSRADANYGSIDALPTPGDSPRLWPIRRHESLDQDRYYIARVHHASATVTADAQELLTWLAANPHEIADPLVRQRIGGAVQHVIALMRQSLRPRRAVTVLPPPQPMVGYIPPGMVTAPASPEPETERFTKVARCPSDSDVAAALMSLSTHSVVPSATHHQAYSDSAPAPVPTPTPAPSTPVRSKGNHKSKTSHLRKYSVQDVAALEWAVATYGRQWAKAHALHGPHGTIDHVLAAFATPAQMCNTAMYIVKVKRAKGMSDEEIGPLATAERGSTAPGPRRKRRHSDVDTDMSIDDSHTSQSVDSSPYQPLTAPTRVSQPSRSAVKYTEEDVAAMERAVAKHGRSWQVIHRLYGPQGTVDRSLAAFDTPQALANKAAYIVRKKRSKGMSDQEIGPLVW